MSFPPPPPCSHAAVESVDGGLRITLPPRGVRVGRANALTFSLVWLILVTGMAVWGFSRGAGDFPIALVILTLMAALGCLILAKGIHRGRLRARVRVSDAGLAIETWGPLGDRTYVWRREEIAGIDLAPAYFLTTRVIPGLAVWHVKGPTRILLAGRDPEELDWLAGVLRQALSLK